jgi:CBS-domain-containing membrane protein
VAAIDDVEAKEVAIARDGSGDAVRLIRAEAVACLPVLDDDGKLAGIVSLGNLPLARDPRSAQGDLSAAPNI